MREKQNNRPTVAQNNNLQKGRFTEGENDRLTKQQENRMTEGQNDKGTQLSKGRMI